MQLCQILSRFALRPNPRRDRFRVRKPPPAHSAAAGGGRLEAWEFGLMVFQWYSFLKSRSLPGVTPLHHKCHIWLPLIGRYTGGRCLLKFHPIILARPEPRMVGRANLTVTRLWPPKARLVAGSKRRCAFIYHRY